MLIEMIGTNVAKANLENFVYLVPLLTKDTMFEDVISMVEVLPSVSCSLVLFT